MRFEFGREGGEDFGDGGEETGGERWERRRCVGGGGRGRAVVVESTGDLREVKGDEEMSRREGDGRKGERKVWREKRTSLSASERSETSSAPASPA